ncbi:hypothetical protein MC885_002170 [Smutsia gigantea]|nr:hypothetical protein MC885_002170 [Smutsia gigantea]
MKAPGEGRAGERQRFAGASVGRDEPRAPSREPDPHPQTRPFRGQNAVRLCCFPPGAAQPGVSGSPRVPRRASTRKPASSWMRSSMPRLPTPKSRSVVMEKRRSCLARSQLLNTTPGEGE